MNTLPYQIPPSPNNMDTFTQSHTLHCALQHMWVTTRPHLLALRGTLLAHTCVGDVGAPALCVPKQSTPCSLLVHT